MRLLNVNTFKIEKKDDLLRDDRLRDNGKYAIVSHRWKKNEVRFSEFEKKLEQDNNIFKLKNEKGEIKRFKEIEIEKIARACSQAQEDKIPYIWMDTCCISDRDLVERSQAINSMFNWYKEAEVCYAFLLDVSNDPKEREAVNKFRKEQNRLRKEENKLRDVEDKLPIEDNYLRPFEKSEWFTRGWTLQELLAPENLHFFDHRWQKIGDKETRSIEVQSATKIETQYLKGNFTGACLAVRMSWAANRRTTIRDDMAYCMLGVFGISMDVRYGENEKAFLRLQEVLVENFNDESIFAWTIDDADSSEPYGLLAPWPSCFKHSDSLTIDCPNLRKERQGHGYSVQRGKTRGIEFEIPGRLPDQGNGVEWNTLIANRRSSYQLGINCWKASKEKAGSVTIELAKDAQGCWRRVNVGELHTGKNLRKSSILFFPTTRPYLIPHTASRDGKEDWGKVLAERVTDQIEKELDKLEVKSSNRP